MGGIQIHSVGARAALGLSALQVAMGWRAGLFEPRASRLIDARGRAVGLCRIGGLGADVHGYDRLVTMAAPALIEATAGADLSGCSLVIALPPASRADDEPRFEQFAADLAQRAGLSFDSAHLIRRGHAGGIDAYRLARELLEGGSAGVVVGGVDSYYHPDVVRTLDEALRLHALDILDGIIPGEGAAFALLRNQASPGDVARLLDASVTSEPAMLDEELPNIADGLTAAVHAVAGNDAPWVMTDVTAEHWRTREWSLIAIRHQLVDAAVTRVASELGDVGAASVAMMTALASTWWRHGVAPAPRALLLASSENDDRGAVVLESAGL